LLVLLAPAGVSVQATNERRSAPNIKTAPPAPIFTDKERVAELAQRRERVAQSVGPQSMMILFSAEPRVYANDVDYIYRQENNLYYLTNLKQKGATLVLLPGNTKFKEILFMPSTQSGRRDVDRTHVQSRRGISTFRYSRDLAGKRV
jgi:hypothetical protein